MHTANAQVKDDPVDNVTPALASITQMQQLHMGAGVTIQTYTMSILAQNHIVLQSFPNLKAQEAQINAGLDGAKAHAKNYLDNIQPKMLDSMAQMRAYIDEHQSVQEALSPDMSLSDLVEGLQDLQDNLTGYKTVAADVIQRVSGFRDVLTSDAAAFNTMVYNFHHATGSDADQLANITAQMTAIQKEINLLIAAAAAGGLAILAGGLLIAVGAATEVFTGGASTAAVVGGIGILAAGVGGEAASGVGLSALIKQKADLVSQQHELQDEIKATQDLVTGYQGFADHAKGSYTAAQNMANAWTSLDSGLTAMLATITKDQSEVEKEYNKKFIIKVMCSTIKKEIADLSGNITQIETQFAGVHQKIRMMMHHQEQGKAFLNTDIRGATPQVNVNGGQTVLELLKAYV